MDKYGIFIGQVMFFVLLFVSTACNKLDQGMNPNELAQQSAVSQTSDQGRIRELAERVLYLENQLQAMKKQDAAFSDISGGARD